MQIANNMFGDRVYGHRGGTMKPQQLSTTLLLTMTLTATCSMRSHAGDICISLLATSSPAEAGMLSAQQSQAMKESDKKFEKAMSLDSDAQMKPRRASDMAELAGDYTSASSPVFAAGAAKELNPVIKSMLMKCATNRGLQGAAEHVNSARNEQVANHVIKTDPIVTEEGKPAPARPVLYELVEVDGVEYPLIGRQILQFVAP